MALEDCISEYPGRGLIFKVDAAGEAAWVYFITGRSDASRARTVRTEPDGLVVVPTSMSAETDVLRHYVCARWADGKLVVGNGDHVDVLARGLEQGRSLEEVVDSIDPEPDPPIWTPRIALVMGQAAHFVSVSRANEVTSRRVHEAALAPNSASVLTTYSGTALEPVGDAPFATVRERRPTSTMCDELFYDHLDERRRVLLIAGTTTKATAPRVDWSFLLS